MSQGPDPFEFIKNFWANVPGMGNMGNNGMGANAMPSFDPKDLEKRLGELKQVKQWLEMNLNMLNLQINTMEMQLSALSSFKGESYSSASKMSYEMPPHEPAAPPDMRQANQAASDAAKAASEAGAQAIAQGAQALSAMPWANPGEWIKSMQAAFVPQAGTSPAKAAARAPARNGSADGTKAAAPAKKRPPARKKTVARGSAASKAGGAPRSRKSP